MREARIVDPPNIPRRAAPARVANSFERLTIIQNVSSRLNFRPLDQSHVQETGLRQFFYHDYE